MNLSAFYAAIAPFLEGRAPLDETLRELYQGAPTRDAGRLAIYGRFCRNHRFQTIEAVYEHCQRAVLRAAGQAAWDELVEAYFRAHPMVHWELKENGAGLPAFLAGHAPAPFGDLPAWLPQLADFEWWEWQTLAAPDDPADAPPEGGPLRLGATVELRRYDYDFAGWLEQDCDARAAAPEASERLVLFWRDRDLSLRREDASLQELMVLKAVSEGAAAPADLRETVTDLHAAGILRGALATSPE